MALTNTDRKVTHAGNGSATVFPYDFPILSDAHLSVVVTDAAGAETTLSPSVYAATGIGGLAGGSVTYPLAGAALAAARGSPSCGRCPTRRRRCSRTRGATIPRSSKAASTRSTWQCQQLAEIVGRATVSSISDPATEQNNYALIQSLQVFRGGIRQADCAG